MGRGWPCSCCQLPCTCACSALLRSALLRSGAAPAASCLSPRTSTAQRPTLQTFQHGQTDLAVADEAAQEEQRQEAEHALEAPADFLRLKELAAAGQAQPAAEGTAEVGGMLLPAARAEPRADAAAGSVPAAHCCPAPPTTRCCAPCRPWPRCATCTRPPRHRPRAPRATAAARQRAQAKQPRRCIRAPARRPMPPWTTTSLSWRPSSWAPLALAAPERG